VTRPRQTITHLKADVLTRHPDNIREGLGDLRDLAASIHEHGILQPITVTEHHLGGYLILAGHRRFAAGQMAGLSSYPAIIRHELDDPTEHTIVMLVENVQRRDLSPVEKAQAFGSLRNRGLSIAEISRRSGVRASTVSTLLTLLELDGESQEKVATGEINAGDAIAAVRQVRQAQRIASSRPQRGRPIVAEPPHFGGSHPLFPYAAAACDHTTRPKVGHKSASACGECWEAVIRADATGSPMPEPLAVDEVVVQRILSGSRQTAANGAERVEVVRRWRAAGRSLKSLELQTGWKVDRYITSDREQAAS
jgi:ParB family chromosome partitioning protein